MRLLDLTCESHDRNYHIEGMNHAFDFFVMAEMYFIFGYHGNNATKYHFTD